MIILNQNITKDIFIRGGWFTNTTTVSIPGITINSTQILDDDTIKINITTGTSNGIFNIEVTNQGGTTIFPNGIEVKLSSWTDLRDGGDVLNIGTDIRTKAGNTIIRTPNGMSFAGLNPWGSWVKFESLKWQRGQNKTYQIIFTRPENFMMVGVGSTATDENSGSQWNQAETLAYFTDPLTFWGLYGNTGTVGSAGNQQNQVSIAGGTGVYKLKFESDGTLGGDVTLYELPNTQAGSWDDEANIITTMTIGGSLNPDEVDIMPFIISRSGTQSFLAIKVE